MLLCKAVDLEVSGEETIEPIYRAREEDNLWVAPQLKQKMSEESLIIHNLLARGPLFSLMRNKSEEPSTRTYDSKWDIPLKSKIPLRSGLFSTETYA